METIRRSLTDRNGKKNGLYVHYSPPKLGIVVGVSSEQLRHWLLEAVDSKLERLVLAGHGRRLLAEAETLPLARHIVTLIEKCTGLHAAVEKGSLLELQELLICDYNRHKYVTCLDEASVGLLHKAVFYNFRDIVEWLVNSFPQLVHQRDSLGRTPLHYTAALASRDDAALAGVLERAGAVRGARDAAGRTLAHYRAARTLLTLPDANMPRPTGQVIKRHNIRIWCHECDMARLQQVVWEGQGARLLSEVSSQPIVKKFLEAVPYIMNTIRDIHNAVVQNDLETLMKLTTDPVPPQALSSRDANNLTVLHKAAGLGHGSILKYLIERYPQDINDTDNDGRTPLHYAAVVKDEKHTYNILVSSGADESAVDNKNKTPAYYINRAQDIDKNVFKVLPEAPRTPSSSYPSSWDWKILDNDFIGDVKKSKKRNLKASSDNITSKNNTSTISETVENNNELMKNSSTHELISGLPDLDDNQTANIISNKITNENDIQNKDSTQIETSTETNEETDTAENKCKSDAEVEFDVIEKNEKEHIELAKTDSLEEVNKTINLVHKETNSSFEDITQNETDQIQLENSTNHDENTDLEETSEKGKTKPDIKEVKILEEITKEEKNTNNDVNEKQDNEDINNKEHAMEKENNNNETANTIVENDMKETSVHNLPDNLESLQLQSKIQESQENIDDNKRNYHEQDIEDYNDEKYVSEISDSKATMAGEAVTSDEGNNGRNIHENPIEGIISSEAEQETEDASIKDGFNSDILILDNEIDPEVTDLINTANMEMLATLVLNGEGSRLVGRQSRNTELQAFLDNVPTYMEKINKVHIAAKEGNIRDLQAALDRRKFAIARDPISANGATPLHVATVFGKTNIMKYLGGRFPETLSAVDFEGRTALHYASVLPDNGHYYNILQQLGANSKDLDDNGRSAEDYYKNPTLFPLQQLLTDFGISDEKAKTMFSDKGHGSNGHMDIPIFHTEEGRYLAKSLGDPLIKGLTEVANVKPKDPVAFLASFLHNFPEHEKPRPGSQESNIVITKEAPEVENEHFPYDDIANDITTANAEQNVTDRTKTAVRPKPIDVITVAPHTETSPDALQNAVSSADRDEHGQSMLHFAAARTHTNNGLFQILQESDISLGYRDELYRTARDVSIQANVLENTAEIDRWVLHLAARGQSDKIMELLLQGYDHILDVVDEDGTVITEVISQRSEGDMSNMLASIPAFEESRESLHTAVRGGDLGTVQAILSAEGGRTLARAQNGLGRNTLHIAVLAQHEDIVEHLAKAHPELLRLGDNLERTALHYAMGVEKIETLSRILIKAGAKRVLKDLKGRQPSYYFMNKSDILRLKEEEEAY